MNRRIGKLVVLGLLVVSGLVGFGQPSLPDLVVTDVSVSPSSFQDGELVTLRATVKNQGEAPVRSGFTVSFFAGDQAAGNARVQPPLQEGQDRSVTALWTAVGSPHAITVRVDTQRKVEEIDEGNNVHEHSLRHEEENTETTSELLPKWKTVFTENFEDGPPEWSRHPNWSLHEEDGNHVLEATGRGFIRPRGLRPRTDYAQTLEFKLVEGPLNLYFRNGGGGTYVINLHANSLTLAKELSDGSYTDLTRRALMLEESAWHSIGVKGVTETLEVSLNGRPMLTYTDSDPVDKGGIALESFEDTEVKIDNIELRAPFERTSPEQWKWARTGGPPGGIGYDVRIDPANPQTIYVTDARSGVHKSTDGGDTWKPINDGITTRTGLSGDEIPIFCLNLDPSDPETLWAGTIDAKGAFRSEDGGGHWERRVNGIDEFPSDHIPTFRWFEVHPDDSETVLAALEISQPNSAEVYGQVYKTTDSGQSWRKVLEAGNLFRRIEFNPDDPSTIYAGTGIFDRDGEELEGIFKSTDGGETWNRINNGLVNLTAPYLAMHPEAPDTLFAATGGERAFGGDPNGVIAKTVNGGEQWKTVLQPQGRSVFDVVEIAPSNTDRIYAAREEVVYRSDDGGETWMNLGFQAPGYQMGIPIGMDIHPHDPDVVYLNSYGGGVYRSEDGGRHWVSANTGYTGARIRDVAVDPRNSQHIYTAGMNGVFESIDGGESYQGLNHARYAKLGSTITRIPNNPRTLLLGKNTSGKVFRSHDGGRSWYQLAPLSSRIQELKRPGLDVQLSITEIIVPSTDTDTIYAATLAGARGNFGAIRENAEMNRVLGIFKSEDAGQTWTAINDGLPSLQVFSLTMDPQDPNTLYAGTLKGVAKSTDGGAHWQSLNAPSRIVQSLAVSPDDSDVVYLGFIDGFYKSVDAGQSWQRSDTGLAPEAMVTSIAVHPSDPSMVFLADARSGVFLSTDAGQSWHAMSDGLRHRAVDALALSDTGNTLYAATLGEGVYRLDLTSEGEQE